MRRVRREASTLPLTKGQRRAIFNGQTPQIAFDADFFDTYLFWLRRSRGVQVRLALNVTLNITAIVEEGKKRILSYTVIDRRPKAERLLRARPHPAATPRRRKKGEPPSKREQREEAEAAVNASELSAYTTNPTLAMPGEPEAISKEEQEALTKRITMESLVQLEASRDELVSRLNALKGLSACSTVDSEIEFVRRRIEAVVDKVERRIRQSEAKAA